MACYLIHYRLRQENNNPNYEKLEEAIKSYGTYAHILTSCWAIVTNETAEEIRDYLLPNIDDDDGLFVVRSGGEAAWSNLLCSDEWLEKHL